MKHLCLLAILAYIFNPVLTQDQPSCDSKIFCQGSLLHHVQMAKLFNDSKTFVDMKIRTNISTTLENFDILMEKTSQKPSKSELEKFVKENFENFNEFDEWSPSDFKPQPKFLEKIKDVDVKSFAGNLVNIWPTLARKIKKEIQDNPELFSLIPVDNGFIIPGGRFREFYYWDSYWIIRGLLLSEMHDTVKGMLENFMSLIERYGFIPNGARVYYLNRSQPPLLTAMVASYIQATNNTDWLSKHVKTLDKELTFWLENKLIDVQKKGVKYTLAHYDSESGSPRPESYSEDVLAAEYFDGEDRRKQLYADLKSAAESGLDFSTRWIVDAKGGIDGNLSSIHTRRIVPVDLNSYLCQSFRQLSEFYVRLNNYDKAIYWNEKSQIWLKTIDQVLYNTEDGIWYDWDVELSQHRKYFFATNLAPLWAGAHNPVEAGLLGKRAANYIKSKGITDYEGGIPTSLTQSGEQWDFPNAWPPLQSIVILGLKRSGDCEAKKLAKLFAERWVEANMIGYNQTNEMFEKYDAVVPGRYGGGGEYTIQTGFGWSNGVVLEFIDYYYT